jgi:hypothetical protein
LGHPVLNDKISLEAGHNKSIEVGKELTPGTYMLRIDFGGKSIQKSIIKMSRT